MEGAEAFYEKLGYSGVLLVQSENHGLDELAAFNKKYEVIGTNIYDGTINQVWLRLPSIDHGFQRAYEEAFHGCSTQMVFSKTF